MDITVAANDSLMNSLSNGKKVVLSPTAKPVFDQLLRLQRQNNYHATEVIKGLASLQSGTIFQSNIFVAPGSHMNRGRETFFMLLPGCKVFLERKQNDDIRVVSFEADVGYLKVQQESVEKPRLYEAVHDGDSWVAGNIATQKVKNTKRRVVAISDRGREDANDAANQAALRVVSASTVNGKHLKQDGFDLHYTPGSGRVGGLINRKKALNPEGDKSIHESAVALARSMYMAKDIEGVSWVSEFGGSGVLTQAMSILDQNNIKLAKHEIFLHRPSTSTYKAIKLAHNLGMKLDGEKVVQADFLDYMGNSEQLETIAFRLKNEEGYTKGKAFSDVKGQIGTAQGVAALGISVGAGVAAALGISATAGTAAAGPALMAFIKAVSGVSAQAAVGAGIIKTGQQLAKSKLPRIYDKIASKF